MERAQIGGVVGRYPAKNGVKLLETLLRLFRAERGATEDFHTWVTRVGEARIQEALEPLKAVPSFDADPSFYQDWGHPNEKFVLRSGVKGECAGTTIAEHVPSVADAQEAMAQAEAYFSHKEYEAALYAGYDAAGAAARVPLYKRLVDPFTSEQALWEFENLFVLSGQTNGAWTGLSGEFARLKAATSDELSARKMLDRARDFAAFATTFWAEPIKYKAAGRAEAEAAG
jgi:hypothetical protein